MPPRQSRGGVGPGQRQTADGHVDMWECVFIFRIMDLRLECIFFPSETIQVIRNGHEKSFAAKPERCPAHTAMRTPRRNQTVHFLPRKQARQSISHSQKGTLCRATNRALPGLYGDNTELQRGTMPRLHFPAGGPAWLCALALPPLLGSVETAVQGSETPANQSGLECGRAVVHPRPSGHGPVHPPGSHHKY
jgi:hypothetical protein